MIENDISEERLIEQFIGGRFISKDINDIIEPLIEPISDSLYRGMMLPIHILKDNLILDEWYGMSHWSLDFNIARNFSLEYCQSDSYIDEVADSLGIDTDEACDLFVPTIIKMDGVSFGLRTYKLASKYSLTKVFVKEQEITTFGIDCIISRIEKCSDVKGEYFLLKAIPKYNCI